MLIHLTPRFFLQYSDIEVDLVDVTIPELEMTLKNGVDLMLKTPYPNKCYKVACRKKGRKAINGILIETHEPLENFTVITRWSVTGVDGDTTSSISTHTTHFHVSDSDYDAITECQMLWNDFYNTPYRSRKTFIQEEWIPAKDQPRMSTFEEDFRECERSSQCYNHINHNSLIVERSEYYIVPTVERERLTVPFFGNDRLPTEDDKFHDIFETNVESLQHTLRPTEFADLGVSVSSFHEFVINIMNDMGESVHDQTNAHLLRILDELREEVAFFFSNTNDLIIKCMMFSETYSALNAKDREYIDNILCEPLFNISMEYQQM
ncbi:TPA: hypothetical protein F6T45_18890 [Escherichia coli]|nr:hypothetical protein [Escherichia coli]